MESQPYARKIINRNDLPTIALFIDDSVTGKVYIVKNTGVSLVARNSAMAKSIPYETPLFGQRRESEIIEMLMGTWEKYKNRPIRSSGG